MFYKAQNDINMAFYDLSFKKMGKNGYRFSVAIPKSIVFFLFLNIQNVSGCLLHILL